MTERRIRTIVFGATQCRELARIGSRRMFAYWRDPARGDDQFPDPDCTVNGRVEVWDPAVVLQWIERTREQRGMVWDREHGLIKRTEVEGAEHTEMISEENDRRMAKLEEDLEEVYEALRFFASGKVSLVGNEWKRYVVGLLPEAQALDNEARSEMLARGMGHLVERHDALVREAWANYKLQPPEPHTDAAPE